jgi:hypothetical protein
LSLYTNTAVAAVVVEIGQNVIKQKRLEIISVLFIFKLGCRQSMTHGTLVIYGVSLLDAPVKE